MSLLEAIFGFSPGASERAYAEREFAEMRRAIEDETPEQKARFFLGVAAMLGNASAAEQLRKMDEIEHAQRKTEPR